MPTEAQLSTADPTGTAYAAALGILDGVTMGLASKLEAAVSGGSSTVEQVIQESKAILEATTAAPAAAVERALDELDQLQDAADQGAAALLAEAKALLSGGAELAQGLAEGAAKSISNTVIAVAVIGGFVVIGSVAALAMAGRAQAGAQKALVGALKDNPELVKAGISAATAAINPAAGAAMALGSR